MDLSNMYNPYDFANPVSDRDLFVGRSDEIGQIQYYLDQAKKAPRPINLAILGERASGKTSILNMIEFEAKKRGFFVARLNLDEGDVDTYLAFFFKVFDSVLTTACLNGAFGGITDKTYETYRDMIDAYEIPENKTFCTFIFPMQYAKAMSTGNRNAPLSETNFGHDLLKIHEELKSPMVLLFDECDVLTKSRVHLEKLRNIFMNTPGFMLVMTGSPSLFPLMNEVFSPIIRQFKKIHAEPFKEQRETKDCILKPLESIGIRHEDIFDLETYLDVRELHNLSGGRPYEIQLLCHVMFRRVQDGRARRMQLDLNVLDDVQKELESSQDVSVRPVLSSVRNLDKKGLFALSLLCRGSGHTTLEQVWFTEYIFNGEKRWTKEKLSNQLHVLERKGILKVENHVISFVGDDFDRIYTKYLARKHKANLSVDEMPMEIIMLLRLDFFLMKSSKNIKRIWYVEIGEIKEYRMHEVAMAIQEESEAANPFDSFPGVAKEVYSLMLDCPDSSSVQVAGITIVSPWMTINRCYRQKRPETTEGHLFDKVKQRVAEIGKRARKLGGDATIKVYDLPVASRATLVKKVQECQNAKIRQEICKEHMSRMGEAYLEDDSIEEAIFHGELACNYDIEPSGSNNLGYLYMVSDNLRRARELLEEAIKGHKDPKDQALPNYNLGIIEAKEHRLERALERFSVAVKQIETGDDKGRIVACLVSPKNIDGELVFKEVKNPDLLKTAQDAITVVNELLEE